MFQGNYTINKENVLKAVRRRLESDAMEEIMANTFRDYCVFFISGILITLKEKYDYSKDELLEIQKSLSNNFITLIKKSSDSNSVERDKAIKLLYKKTGIKYNEKEDKFE